MAHAYLNPRPTYRPHPEFDRRTADAQYSVDRDAIKIERVTGLSRETAQQLAERIHFSN